MDYIIVGKAYIEKRDVDKYLMHYYYVMDDRILHINTFHKLITVHMFDNCYTINFEPKFVKSSDDDSKFFVKGFFHNSANVNECNIDEFKNGLVQIFHNLQLFKLLDLKKLFDSSKTPIKEISDLF